MDLATLPPELQQKMHSEDRILVLEQTGEQKSLIDTTQELHAIRGPADNLWRLKYKHGIVPAALKQGFTTFNRLLAFTNAYFGTRNIKITEVKDVYPTRDN